MWGALVGLGVLAVESVGARIHWPGAPAATRASSPSSRSPWPRSSAPWGPRRSGWPRGRRRRPPCCPWCGCRGRCCRRGGPGQDLGRVEPVVVVVEGAVAVVAPVLRRPAPGDRTGRRCRCWRPRCSRRARRRCSTPPAPARWSRPTRPPARRCAGVPGRTGGRLYVRSGRICATSGRRPISAMVLRSAVSLMALTIQKLWKRIPRDASKRLAGGPGCWWRCWSAPHAPRARAPPSSGSGPGSRLASGFRTTHTVEGRVQACGSAAAGWG